MHFTANPIRYSFIYPFWNISTLPFPVSSHPALFSVKVNSKFWSHPEFLEFVDKRCFIWKQEFLGQLDTTRGANHCEQDSWLSSLFNPNDWTNLKNSRISKW